MTILGVAATVSLLLFLFAVHAGVKDGSTRYVRTAGVDLWICQPGTDNLLKSSSFVPASLAARVRDVEGVRSASPLLRAIAKAEIGGNRSSTLFLFGFDPVTRLGEPATVVSGSSRLARGEIVVDESFARKYALAIGDRLTIHGRAFRLAGLSRGTNTLVAQFGFLRFDDAEAILGLRGTASFILAKVDGDPSAVAERIRRELTGLTVYDAETFTANHEEEMESGVLPVFAAAAVFAAAVGGLIVALMLYTSALERRDDYATLKALGAGDRHLLRLVVQQSAFVTTLGCIAGALLSAFVSPLLLRLVPALALRYTPEMLLVLPAALFIGACAAAAPLRVLRRIYPGEVFRA